MNIIDVWGNTFVPLLVAIPLLVLVLFGCCTCVDKTIIALRKSYIFHKCKPRTPRRVRFDCEAQRSRSHSNGSGSGSHARLARSNTAPRLSGISGLMAHSSYLQTNSNYRYHTMVHADRMTTPQQVRTVLDRDYPHSSSASASTSTFTAHSTPISTANHNHNNVFGYHHANRRSSTPTPPNSYYTLRPKSPFESCGGGSGSGAYLDPKQKRRYSTPNSPTMYAYPNSSDGHDQDHSPSREESNLSTNSYLPEVRAYLQFMEVDPSSRQRSHSFSGRNSSRSSSRRSSRRSSRHRARSRSPSPYALERTQMATASDDMGSNYSNPSIGRYLTPQGSSDQGSFRSPESGTPDWLDALEDVDIPASFQESLSNLSRSSSIRTSFI